MTVATAGHLEATLRAARERGEKILVPYITAGFSDEWIDVVRAVAANGANAIEIGLPFSDPMIDGPVIQEASQRALDRGTTPHEILAALVDVDVDIPLVVMTYTNLVAHMGYRRMAQSLNSVGVAGAILPDLPLEEAEEWLQECAVADIEPVLLVAPTTPDDRLAAICAKSRGFVYGVGLLGVTGERSSLSTTASLIAQRVKQVTDLPALVGIGISNGEQAVQVCEQADGVIVGSALVRRLLEGAGPEGAGEFVGELRHALDRVS